MTDHRFDKARVTGNVPRTKFNMPHSIKTAINVGELVPYNVMEVLPGDTINLTTSLVARLTTPLKPTMDNLFIDYFHFFVPCRLVWDNWKYFMGEQKSAWIDDLEYTVPGVPLHNGVNVGVGSIGDYMGIPGPSSNSGGLTISELPLRAYGLIYNEWFRDQNLQDPLYIDTSDSVNLSNLKYHNKPLMANKYHDYFTSALPSPQKGPTVYIPFDDAFNLPVIAKSNTHSLAQYNTLTVRSDNNAPTSGTLATSSAGAVGVVSASVTNLAPTKFTNLWATSEGSSFGVPTINALRLAFQIQRIYEKDARGGSRYVEILKSHFGVISPDARQQRPEYLGGGKITVGIQQTPNMTASADNKVGEMGAYSYTGHSKHDYVKSFTEHGYVISIAVSRYRHSYSQGLHRMWSRKDRFDFYDPTLAHLGEQPIFKKEIYTSIATNETDVFGYQEAWADYRYRPSIVTGIMRPEVPNSLGVWHYADNYSSYPTLSATWIQEAPQNVARTLAVTPSPTAPALILDIYNEMQITRPLPQYSIPGMIDHF